MNKRFGLFFVLQFLFAHASLASPWVRDYITREQKTKGASPSYEFSLYLFTDPFSVTSSLDLDLRANGQKILLAQKNGNLVKEYLDVSFVSTTDVSFSNPICAQNRSLGIRIYRFSVIKTLDRIQFTDPAGYYLAWERCCRNTLLGNIASAGQAGIVLYSEFTALSENGQDVNNSLPVHKDFVADFACRNTAKSLGIPFRDSEADLLSYKLAEPLKGHHTPANSNALTLPGPYDKVIWQPGFDLNRQSPNPTPIQINSTGILKINSGSNGLFAFSFEVEEKRNNRVMGKILVNFQIPVSNCNFPIAPSGTISFADGTTNQKSTCGEEVELNANIPAGYNLQWTANGVPLFNANSSILRTIEAGNYAVSITDANNCSNESLSNILIVKSSKDSNKIVSSDDIICNGSSLTLNNSGDIEVIWYRSGTVVGDGKTLETNQDGLYHIRTKGNTCPGFADTLVLSRFDYNVSDYIQNPGKFDLCVTNNFTLEIQDNSSYQYTWLKENSLINNEVNHYLRIIEPGAYKLQIRNQQNNCVLDLPTVEFVKPNNCTPTISSYFPNSFSPNSDGINDILEFPFSNLPPSTQVKVYNRWGEVVYESSLQYFAWDGRVAGKVAEAGLYTVFFNQDNSNSRYSIYLIR